MDSSLAHRRTHLPRFLSRSDLYLFFHAEAAAVCVCARLSVCVCAIKSSLFSSSRFMHLSNVCTECVVGVRDFVRACVRADICVWGVIFISDGIDSHACECR